jgi:hypothetical protein
VVDALLAQLRATGREPGDPEVAAVLTTSDEHELPDHALAALSRALREAEAAVPA